MLELPAFSVESIDISVAGGPAVGINPKILMQTLQQIILFCILEKKGPLFYYQAEDSRCEKVPRSLLWWHRLDLCPFLGAQEI